MKPKMLIVVVAAAVLLCGSVVLAANHWGIFDVLSKNGGTRDGKGLSNAPYQDVLDTAAPGLRYPAQNLLVGVATAGQRVVAVGQHGNITYTDNQGKSWLQAAVPVSSDLLAVHFPTASKGWAVGHDGVVLHTEDGGITWSKQFDGRAAAQVMVSHYFGSGTCGNCHKPTAPPAEEPSVGETAETMSEVRKFVDQGPDKPFLDVWFENENNGFIVGAFNLVFRTTDGGKSWEPWYDRIDNPKHYHLYSIRPVGGELYLTAEQGTLFRLDRTRGRFVELKTPYSGTLFGVTGKAGSLIAFGMRGNAFRSSDNGANWQKVETGVPTGLTGSALTESGKIVLVSQGGHVLVSSDDGASFSQAKVGQQGPASAVAAVDKTSIALVGPAGARIQKLD